MSSLSASPVEDVAPPSKFVAIGGSHVGMAAVSTLVGYLPPTTGLSFAIVLGPDTDDTALASHLGEHTAMNIITVVQPTAPRPDHIYIPTRGNELAFVDHCLVAVRPDTNGAPCSADRLFRAAAVEYGASSVAIVLAGDGADGAIGLKLVKEMGGATFAQVPGETLPDEMARMSIGTGMVDFVLPLSEIASRISDAEHVNTVSLVAVESSDDVLRELLILLRVRTGHDFTQYKRATLLRRVARRVQVTNSATIDEYIRVVRQDPAEVSALLRDFMISVTNFFRDREAFEALEHTFIPRLFQAPSNEPIRVWVAGCATGEEVYSIGMLLLEKRAELDPTRGLQIFATDIDEEALVEARAGRYLQTIAADVSTTRLARFFTRDGDYVRVTKELRELVLFASHSVLRDAPFSRVDLVSCRNLLIYLDRPMQEHLLRTAHFSLKSAGYLFLGSSENADTPDNLFETVDARARIYQRQAKRTIVLPSISVQPRWAAPAPIASRADSARSPSVGELHYRMVERFAPPSILLNARFEAIHISQHATRYLELPPGEVTHEVLQMVLPDLRLDLRAAIYAARRTPQLTSSTVSNVMIDGQSRLVRLGVRLDDSMDAAHANILVWFEEAAADQELTAAVPDGLERIHIGPVVSQLEEDLRQAREQLRTTVEQYETLVEELHASNEEQQAVNEELRSASEEIEASREESDSVNQELTTVNQELKLRIAEALAAKSDIANLMESSDIGAIFVDREFRIQRFTQRTREVFNILNSDVGRPLSDLTLKIDYPDLNENARTVFETLQQVEREVRHANDYRYLVRIRPYRALDDGIAGVVITFIDITLLRRTEGALRTKETTIQLAERAANAGAWQLGADSILLMSPQCHALYGTTPRTHGLKLDEWTSHVAADDRARVEHAVDGSLRSDAMVGLDVEFKIHHPTEGERWLWMLGRKADTSPGVAGITLDVTAARSARAALELADRRKNEFIATLAHELRNPLMPLALALDLQEMVAGDESRLRETREMMKRQVAQLKRLVDDLLDISRIQSGRIELRVEASLSLSNIVATAAEAVRSLVDEQGHRLVLKVPSDVRLDGDPVRLTQIFVNLLTNAAKYSNAQGTITVSADHNDRTVTVTVTDTGIGIAKEMLPTIFDLFVQAEPILTRARGGIGIGLSLVRQLVSLHGGTITAHSEGQDKGSRFVVMLPLHQPKVLS